MDQPITINQYLVSLPPQAITPVNKIRAIIKKLVPKADEGVNYGIGGFKQNRKYFVYYAGYEKHTSLYPAPRGHKYFEKELKNYKGGKGTVQFPIGKPLPLDLIKRIVVFRLLEINSKVKE